jgi:prepilin-type N-terminal cleavage/methylation domain-containing protein/prepilin-type processing-associated H-X9-DG protein
MTELSGQREIHGSHGRGFTLVELIVVISIISILISIVMPSLGKARSSAFTAVCTSNLRNINNALSHYVNSYNQLWPTTIGLSKLPSRRLPVARQLTQLNLVAQLKPWLKNQDVWFDPVVPADGVEASFARVAGDPGPVVDPATGTAIRDYRDGAALNTWSYRAVGTTYLFNQFTILLPSLAQYPGHVYQGKPLGTVYDASKAVALWDDPSCAGPVLEKQFTVPHSEGINVSYVDGHVSWVPLRPLGTEENPQSNIWASTGVLEEGWLEKPNPYTMDTCGG